MRFYSFHFLTTELSSSKFTLLLFTRLVVSNSLRPHGLQHTRLPCPSPSPRVHSNSCPLSQWYHPTISTSVAPFSSCLQYFPASGSLPMTLAHWNLIKIYIMKVKVTQSCPTLCNPMDYSLPSSTVHGIFQARILEWVAISFSRWSSRPRDWTQVSHTVGRRFTIWATREQNPVLIMCNRRRAEQIWLIDLW